MTVGTTLRAAQPAVSERDRRLKVLVSAFSCNPELGSEPGAGWLWSTAAASRHDVWLLTNEVFRPAIDAAVARLPHQRLRVCYVPQPRWLPGGPCDLRLLRARYLVWQAAARRIAVNLHAEVRFDVAHHLTLAADWMPPGVGAVRDLPLVWGPVGGYTRPAWPLARWLGPRWVGGETLRRATTAALRAGFGRWTMQRASLAVAQNPDVAGRLHRLGPARVVVEPNLALAAGSADPAAPIPPPAARRPGVDVSLDGFLGGQSGGRALFAGRLLRWKGVALAVRAMAEPDLRGWTLDIIGDGPDRPSLERLVRRLDLDQRIVFHGHRERDEVLAAMGRCDVLVLPSINDSAGWVVGEAAAAGCGVVCLERGGPPHLARSVSGRVVPVDGDVPAALASAISRSGRLPAPVCNWGADRLAALVDGWYRSVLGSGPSRADHLLVHAQQG